MNNEEARRILALFRPQRDDPADPFFAEALKQAERDPELAAWLAEEQEFDRMVAAGVNAMVVPRGNRAAIISKARAGSKRAVSWAQAAVLAAAALVFLALILNTWSRFVSPAVSLEDYRGEIIGFVKLTPPLEFESHKAEKIKEWLERAQAPAVEIPAGLRELEPVGCRILAFRGRKVALICFDRGGGKLVHLVIVDRSVLQKLPSKDAPVFAPEGEWMTAAWQEADQAYLLTSQGDKALLEEYLKSS